MSKRWGSQFAPACKVLGRKHWLITAMFVVAFPAGCDSGHSDTFARVPIQGTVTWKGLPLKHGEIRFIPNQQGTTQTVGPKVTLSIVDGQFRADSTSGPVQGAHRVEINLISTDQPAHDDEQAWVEMQKKRVRRPPRAQLPARFNAQSELTAVISRPDAGEPMSLSFPLGDR